MPVIVLHVPATWHWSDAAQVTGFAPVQVPAIHVSVCVHALLSLHVEPSGLFGLEHMPVIVLHVPATWHWSDATHVMGFAPEHVPAWQLSVCVQALPSLQTVPAGLNGLEQTPVIVLHTPGSWHWLNALHTTGFAPEHAPP